MKVRGFSITVSDEEILNSREEVSHKDGMLFCPEGAATFAAFKKSLHMDLYQKMTE